MTDPVAIWNKVSVADADDPGNVFKPQFNNAVAVTKSDSTVYSPPLEQIWVGGTGDLAVITAGGDIVTFTNVPDGRMIPVRCTKVLAATTATDIVGLR